MKKLYVNPKQQVTILCDHCGGLHTTKVPLHIRGNAPAKVKCLCGKAQNVTFKFRQAYRIAKTRFCKGSYRGM